VFVTGGERPGSAERAGKEREKREERKEKREKKRKKKGKEMEKERKNGKKEKGGGACAPAATAAAVGHARRWSRVRGPGEVRHAEQGGGAATRGRKGGAGPSVLGRGGEGERREREKERERDSR
jgi:chromatin remodeling complex protein RSC6